MHDFPTDAEGKAIPYGVYDMARNEAWVSVGRDHDTPAFAVASIRHWWRKMGRRAYPRATTLYITADPGGSNGWQVQPLQGGEPPAGPWAVEVPSVEAWLELAATIVDGPIFPYEA